MNVSSDVGWIPDSEGLGVSEGLPPKAFSSGDTTPRVSEGGLVAGALSMSRGVSMLTFLLKQVRVGSHPLLFLRVLRAVEICKLCRI